MAAKKSTHVGTIVRATNAATSFVLSLDPITFLRLEKKSLTAFRRMRNTKRTRSMMFMFIIPSMRRFVGTGRSPLMTSIWLST